MIDDLGFAGKLSRQTGSGSGFDMIILFLPHTMYYQRVRDAL